MPAFLKRNERQHAAAIEVAERIGKPFGRVRRRETLCACKHAIHSLQK